MTAIEWTWVPDGKGGRKKGETVNPLVGCTEKSPACRHCYAAAIAHRGMAESHRGLTVMRDNGVHWNGKINRAPSQLAKPLRWRKPRGIFWGSMTDLFHESTMATEDGRRYIAACFGVMAATPQHTHMVVTKRPKLMREWFAWVESKAIALRNAPQSAARKLLGSSGLGLDVDVLDRIHVSLSPDDWPLPNVWILTTVEDQKRADERIPDLLACPAAVHGLSIEPMLGPVVLPPEFLALGKRGWAITGGESGSKARPSHPQWFRDIRDQAAAAGVPYFHKQMGEWTESHADTSWWVSGDGTCWPYAKAVQEAKDQDMTFDPKVMRDAGWATVSKVGKKKAGRELDGRTWDEFPEAL